MRRAGALAAVGLALLAAGCGDANVVTPSQIAQNYVVALAEGDDAGACALLTAPTRSALLARAHASSCPGLLAHCLPTHAGTSTADQAQLFYVNVDLTTNGPRARAVLSGLPVARSVREVTLLHHDGRWRLTSAGHAVSTCVAHRRRHRRHSARG